MSRKSTYRNSTFNIPSNRNLWHSLGEFDALVEYQEVASRNYLDAFNVTKETFRDYLIRTSSAVGIYLNDITLDNFKQVQHQGYLVFPNASFDEFISAYVKDVKFLVTPGFELSNNNDECKFDRLLNALSVIGITPKIDDAKVKLYHYYRLLRNDIAHRLNKDYAKEYDLIDCPTIQSFYPTLGLPMPKNKLDFDDFILCTANIKNIADILTLSIFPHIDWKKVILEKKEQIIPRYSRFIHEKRPIRLRIYIKNCVAARYGIRLSETIVEEIAGSLE
ncbi:MAG: hypothetical protein Q4F85_13660 [Prevotella sp.]|nr:hypothetical protein [Prevotella sp.]